MYEQPIQVAIADDQRLLRQTLRMLIDAQPDMAAPWEASNGHEAVALVAEHHPDVLLLDIRMPGLDGLGALQRIRDQAAPASTKILMLTMYELDDYVRRALSLGANGFLLKDAEPEQILTAIRRVHQGDPQLSPSITASLIHQYLAEPTAPSPNHRTQQQLNTTLTPREREVLTLIGQGLTNEEIMAELVISKGTIKSHIAALRRKTNARDRVQLALLGQQLR